MSRLTSRINEASASRTTALQESLFCIGMAITQITKKSLTIKDLSDPEIFENAASTYCDIDVISNDVYEFAMGSQKWSKSVIGSVNVFKKSPYLKNKIYKISRGRGIMNQVYSMALNLLKKDKIKLHPDKWNPSDVWLSTIPTIPSFDNIYGYNEWISKKLKAGTLIGVSLKQTSTPKVIYINQTGDKPQVLYKGTKKPTTAFNTGISIATSIPKLDINVRSFRTSTRANITSEMIQRGSSARHGKTAITKYVKKYRIPQMTIREISKHEDNLDHLVNMVSTLWMDNGHTFPDSKIQKDWSNRVNKMDNTVGYFRSIINSLQYGAFLYNNKGIANQIITEMYRIGSSMGDYSSDFIKIY